MIKLKLLILLLIISNLSFAQDIEGQLLKNPTLELTPFIGHKEQQIQLVHSDKEGGLDWNDMLTWGGLVQLKEKRTIFSVGAQLITDRKSFQTFQSSWLVSYDWQIMKQENIYLQVKLFADQNIPSTDKFGYLESNNFTIGLHYNNVLNSREYNDLVNFYGQVNYIIYGEQQILKQPWPKAEYTGMLESTFGVVINLMDILFFEQNVNVYTLPTGWITMLPQHSFYDTKVWLQHKDLRLIYTHTCYHTFIDKKESFPIINGGQDQITLQYTFKWHHTYQY